MLSYKESIEKLLKDIKFILPVIITAILSFGFTITNFTINGDALSYDRYFEKSELLAQGRFTAPLINKLFSVMNFNPFFVDIVAAILIVIGAILFCMLFDRVLKGKFNNVVYTIFTCLFVSYPLISEIFTFTPAGISIGVGYCLVAISLMYGYESIFNGYSKIKAFIMQTILLCLAVFLYESFAAVYLCGIFMILIIEYLYNKNKFGLLEAIKKIIVFALPLGVAIILGVVIVILLMKILDLERSTHAAKTIVYRSGIFYGLKNLVVTIIDRYVLPATYYLPIKILAISTCIYLVITITNIIKEKSFILALLLLGLGIAVQSLSIIQGMAAIYRTCQTFALFIAFVFMIFAYEILSGKSNKWIKRTVVAIVFVIVFYQSQELNKWFVLNYQRYDIEKNDVIAIGNEIRENFDINKPVYFMGNYKLPSAITSKIYVDRNSTEFKISMDINKLLGSPCEKFKEDSIEQVKYGESNIISYVGWSMYAFGEDKEVSVDLIKFFRYFGYDIKSGSRDIYDEVVSLKPGKPRWPSKGSIFETDEYIVVNF